MEISEHIAALRREGELLAIAALAADPDAPVPTCPEWRVRDLVKHIGMVHRWAAANVAQPSTAPMTEQQEQALIDRWPDDESLVAWFRAGHAALIQTLEAARPDLVCWSFLPAPSPLAFWARRQAHETGIHRVDAERAVGPITPFPADFAADGIDELLCGFVSRPGGRLRAVTTRTLHVRATDVDRDWFVCIGPERVEVHGRHPAEDCLVAGTASDLYLLLWNRRTEQGLAIGGDRTLLDLWRESVRIRWS